jgi:hypothetical protein
MTQLIQDSLEKEIKQFLAPYLQHFYDYRIDSLCYDPRINSYSGKIEVIGKVKELDCGETQVIYLSISEGEVQISIIFMPNFMKMKNIGKDLISIIYKIVKKYNYNLFITNLTASFYSKLVSRGALVIEENDIVQITDGTNLRQKINI